MNHFAMSESESNELPPKVALELQRKSRLALAGFAIALISLFGFIDVRLAVISPLATVFGVAAVVTIRRHPLELKGMKLAVLASCAGPLLFVGALSFHQIKLQLEVPEGYTLISWLELAPDEKTPNVPFSKKSQEFQGKNVYLRGYVYPSTKKNNLQKFILVRDSGTCCFGGQPKLTDMIVVDFVNDDRINYSMWPRGIGGKFILQNPERDFSGLKLGCYYLKADHLK